MTSITNSSPPLPPALDFLRRIWRLNHAIERRSSHMQATLGVTAQQRMVIRCIGWQPGITAGALAELLSLDKGTLSAALRRLEERKLVKRVRHADDSRRVTLTLTARGRRLDVPAAESVEAVVEEFLAGAGRADVARGARVLDRLASLLLTGGDAD
jgi:MarR family transcriptional regulator, organic hydroperoxide resistance regulator